jgi:hypothetical protein
MINDSPKILNPLQIGNSIDLCVRLIMSSFFFKTVIMALLYFNVNLLLLILVMMNKYIL